MVDADAEEILDRALCELLAAVGIGGVDFIVAVARDGDACVARDGEERRLLFRRVDGRDHERVAASHVVRALVDAHDHDGRLVLGGQELFLLLRVTALVEQTALGEKHARDRREDKNEDRTEDDKRPDTFLWSCRSERRW